MKDKTQMKIVELRTFGHSIREIARAVGLSKSAVHKRLRRAPSRPAFKRLFWDIETAPHLALTWRVGHNLSLDHDNIVRESGIICICWKWEHESSVHALTWNAGDDRELMEQFVEILNEADEIVAHNGDRFDLRWFRWRCLVHGIPVRYEYNTVDTLKNSRKYVRAPSHRLDYLSQTLLGDQKRRTDYSLWRRILLDNDPDAMRDMVAYCKKDVVLLEELFQKFQPYVKDKTHRGVATGGERWHCPNCASDRTYVHITRTTAAGLTRRGWKCRECHKYFTTSDMVYKQKLLAEGEE